MQWPWVVELLRAGTAGLSLLLAWLAFRLVQDGAKGARTFMSFSLALVSLTIMSAIPTAPTWVPVSDDPHRDGGSCLSVCADDGLTAVESTEGAMPGDTPGAKPEYVCRELEYQRRVGFNTVRPGNPISERCTYARRGEQNTGVFDCLCY